MKKAYVYHNEYGEILAVAPAKLKEMLDTSFITINWEDAEGFFTGQKDPHRFEIVNNKISEIVPEPMVQVVINQDVSPDQSSSDDPSRKTIVVTTRYIDDVFYEVPNDVKKPDVKLEINVDKKKAKLTLSKKFADTFKKADEINYNAKELTFYITEKDVPSVLHEELVFQLEDLISTKTLSKTVDLTELSKEEAKTGIDVYTKRITEKYCYKLKA